MPEQSEVIRRKFTGVPILASSVYFGVSPKEFPPQGSALWPAIHEGVSPGVDRSRGATGLSMFPSGAPAVKEEPFTSARNSDRRRIRRDQIVYLFLRRDQL